MTPEPTLHIIERPTAKQFGLKKYYTGRPCKQGHLAEKRTTTGYCVQCSIVRSIDPARIQYERDYYQANKDHVLQRSRQYHAKNPQKAIENARKWSQLNPERRRVISISYKAKRRSQEAIGAKPAELLEWEKNALKTCYWCGIDCAGNYHIDHYEPLSKGGTHTVDNLVIACPSCNLRKSNKDPYIFAAQVGRLF